MPGEFCRSAGVARDPFSWQIRQTPLASAEWEREIVARLRESRADVCAVSPKRTRKSKSENEVAGAAVMSGKARRLHSRLHADAQEAQFSTAQGGSRAPDKQH